MSRSIDWKRAAHLMIGLIFLVFGWFLSKAEPMWIWGGVGFCGMVLILIELPKAGGSRHIPTDNF